jgi:hypothetical protein
MIDYTLAVRLLMEDVVARVPALSHIDLRQVLVFARLGRADAHGAYATCHSLVLPDSEPAYYYWRDRRTGALSRRSEWFVMRTPEVRLGGRRISHLISIALPRFCNQTLKDTHKARVYERGKEWIAKLDTIVHELYHVDPDEGGIRQGARADGSPAAQAHTPQFFREVQRMVREYVASRPDSSVSDFLSLDYDSLVKRHGGVAGTTFRDFPAFPQRYRERLDDQPRGPRAAQVVPLPLRAQRRHFTEADLVLREFLPGSTRRL